MTRIVRPVIVFEDIASPSIIGIGRTVNEDVPANTVGNVQIKATSEEISGLFFTLVEKGERSFDIGFVIGYLPVIALKTPEGVNFEIPPLSHTRIPIKFENLGNGHTLVAIEIIDKPKNWDINFPSSLRIGSPAFGEVNKKEINISVSPPKDFSHDTIKISITPSLLGDPSNKGKTEIIIFTFKNDGTYKEDIQDFLLIIIVIIIVSILIVLGLIFVKRKYFTK